MPAGLLTYFTLRAVWSIVIAPVFFVCLCVCLCAGLLPR